MKYLPVCLFAILLTVPAMAGTGDYYDGYVNSEGYAYHSGDNYWWKGGTPYTRTLYTHTDAGSYGAGYYYCGRYYQGAYTPGASYDYWKYTAASYTPPAVQATVPYTPEWKTKVLEMLKARDDHATYLQTLKLAGFPLPIDQGPVPESVNSSYASSYNTGNTVWGYSQKQTAYAPAVDASQLTNMGNLAILYQALNRSVENNQKLVSESNAGLASITQLATDGNSQTAQRLAEGIAASMALQGAKSNTVTQSFKATSIAPPVAHESRSKSVLQENCASCHDNGKAASQFFKISDYDTMTREEKASRVWSRIVPTADPEYRMPKDGPPLSSEKIIAIMSN